MRTGMLRLLLCDPTAPCVSKPSCSSWGLVPTHAELGSVHGHAQHRLSTGRFPPAAVPAPGWPHPAPGFAAAGAHAGGKELLLQVSVAFSAGLGVIGALASLTPVPALLPCLIGTLTWHHCGDSMLALSPLVSPSPPHRTPACREQVTAASPDTTTQRRTLPKPMVPNKPSWLRNLQTVPAAAAAQIPFLLSEAQSRDGITHTSMLPPPEQSPPAPEVLPLSLSPERVPAHGEHRAYPEGFWGGLLALAVCDRSRVEGWSWRRSRLLLLIRSLAGSSGFCGLRHRGGGLKSVTGHQQHVRARHGCGHPRPTPGTVTSGWGLSMGWVGRARSGAAGRFSCLHQGDHRRSWSPHSPSVVRRALSMVPAL